MRIKAHLKENIYLKRGVGTPRASSTQADQLFVGSLKAVLKPVCLLAYDVGTMYFELVSEKGRMMGFD